MPKVDEAPGARLSSLERQQHALEARRPEVGGLIAALDLSQPGALKQLRELKDELRAIDDALAAMPAKFAAVAEQDEAEATG